MSVMKVLMGSITNGCSTLLLTWPPSPLLLALRLAALKAVTPRHRAADTLQRPPDGDREAASSAEDAKSNPAGLCRDVGTTLLPRPHAKADDEAEHGGRWSTKAEVVPKATPEVAIAITYALAHPRA
mmetsp:Transcript_127932/g.409861  ORF Transcript_127932/g.409861 Transcript_127932/m.409861 type:complete len:127 (-) Transcript_127932:67-447(-)